MNINTNKYLIPAAIVLAGILIAGGYVFINYWPIGTLSSQAAADKAMTFINKNIEQGVTASLVNVSSQGSVYQISLKINEIPYESYITKDGKFLFPTGINLEAAAIETPAETSAATASFAQCLTAKSMKFYGSKNCSWCDKEKELFGISFQYINYIECIDSATGGLTKTCQDAKIESFPTWQLPGGKMESGFKTLEQLAETSGCLIK
ncbi:MAG: hypothetical protein UV98_C0003G0006 [Parcubacteria group bacterium GW2011_GWB1_43_6]|nr:MAG: hypothetical protein UV98_C0003G0006 [Parcubacteria group bacterium GW2011_GWB1_43_6]